MQAILAVAVGGAIGSVARFLTVRGAMLLFGAGFPAGTLFVNVLGSFLMGCLVAFFGALEPAPLAARAFWTAGILGGFTTFSAFSYEAVSLYQEGNMASAILYTSLSLILSFAAVAAGLYLFRQPAL